MIFRIWNIFHKKQFMSREWNENSKKHGSKIYMIVYVAAI